MGMTAFEEKGFVLLPDVIAMSETASLCAHVCECLDRKMMSGGDPLVPGAPSIYGDPVLDNQLERLVPLVEASTGKQIFPTYSYGRIYRRGDRLPRHTDRPSCEISMTVNIDHESEPWPLWLENRHGRWRLEITRGSAVIYTGIDTVHWREPLIGEWAVQIFMHYVDQNGPHSHLRFDGRTALGTPRQIPA
jgi:hypothetical protein